jgi:hypothetical protein
MQTPWVFWAGEEKQTINILDSGVPLPAFTLLVVLEDPIMMITQATEISQ